MKKDQISLVVSLKVITLVLLIQNNIICQPPAPQKTIYPSEEKPTACEINTQIKDLESLEGIASICQMNNALLNPLKLEGKYDEFNTLFVEHNKIPLFIPGCTYLKERKECINDDSTGRCALFTVNGCTHCWKKFKANFTIPGKKGYQLEEYWQLVALNGPTLARNYCVDGLQ